MFTGIVEGLGTVTSFLPLQGGGGARLVVECPFGAELAAGESVAVNGCCLTQLPGGSPSFVADLSPETLACTALSDLAAGSPVNLERAMALGDRLGGHLVQGHVDGVATVVSAIPEGSGARHRYAIAPGDEPFYVPKGSVTVDGVSLTVAALGPGWFEVALIPHTLACTALSRHVPGSRVNVEMDLVGKYLLRAQALSGRLELPAAARARLGLP